jgi:hypothetical protein
VPLGILEIADLTFYRLAHRFGLLVFLDDGKSATF